MKQKDIVVIIAIVIVSAVLAAVTSKFIFKPSDKQQKVEIVQPISADFPDPDARFFNKNSIDPTQLIQIGGNQNTDPFKGVAQ